MIRRPFAALVLALTLSFACRPAVASLIASWSFDGCTTTDASGHAANLTAHASPTCIPGRFGDAWSLDGTSQFLDRSFDPIFTPGNRSWTVAIWEKSTTTTRLQTLVEWYRCGANPGCNQNDGANYILMIDHGHPMWDVRDDSIDDLTATDTTLNVSNGAWHLVVGTLNSTTDSTKLYVDGALRAVVHQPLGALTDGGVAIPLEVGRHFRTGWGSPDFYFAGAIDEARIYDEELSAAAIAALFSAGTTAVGDQAQRRLAIERCWPNPVRGGRALVGFDLPSDAPAELEVFDLAGRRLADHDGLRGVGRHQIELGAAGALEPGVYLVRLTQAGTTATRRLTVLE
jgi:hypothetical protein